MTEGLFGDPQVDRVMDALHSVPGWPADPVRDDAFVRSLMADYPYADLVDQIEKWKVYLAGEEARRSKIQNWLLTFRTWMRNERRWGVERRSNRSGASRVGGASGAGAGGSDSRPTTRAGAPGEYGGVSGRLDNW